VSAFPLAGHIPFVRDWAGFVEYFMCMKGFGIVASMKDFYWDIRPKPEYGTVEIRVCDTPLTVRRAALVAAYAQALAAWHLEARPLEPSPTTYTVNSFNRFEACRYGLRGTLVDPYLSRKTAIGEDILATMAKIAPYATRLGCGALVHELAAGVRAGDSDAAWLRARHAARGSLADVVREACTRWERGG
jgi:carboxylate-amine ligase